MSKNTRLLFTSIVMIAVSGLWALGFNAVREDGIPILRSRTAQNQENGNDQLLNLERAKRFFDEGAVFVDTRSPGEFQQGHIEGALHLYYHDVERDWEKVLGEVAYDQPIICYCSGEGCNSSFLVAEHLMDVGFEKVYIFDGGWPMWSAAKYPLIGQAAPPPPLYQVK